MLFTNWSLITWLYGLNVSVFCLSCFNSDFRRPKLQNLLLLKDILFLFHRRPVSYQPPLFLASCRLNFFTHSYHDLGDSVQLLVHLHYTDSKNHSLMFLYIVNWLSCFLFPVTLWSNPFWFTRLLVHSFYLLSDTFVSLFSLNNSLIR